MKEYEMIWEIYNKCPRNQMRDIFVEEIETDDLDAFMQSKVKGEDVVFEKHIQPDGTIIYDVRTSDIRQRYSFTEI